MKSKTRRYKYAPGVQQIAMDTPDYSKALALQATEGAKSQGITQAAGTLAGNFKPIADIGSGLGSIIKSNNKSKTGAQLGEAVSMGASGAALGTEWGNKIGGPYGAAIGATAGLVGGGIYGALSGGKEYEKGKKLQKEAERTTALSTANAKFADPSTLNAQSYLAKKGKYKVAAKQPRMIETEGREPIFSPKDKNGKRKLLYYNPNDPTHEEGGVKAVVVPKKGLGTNMLMPKRSKESLLGSGNMAYGAKQIKVDNINNTAFNQHLIGQIPVNAANNFMQPKADIMQVARNIPEDRRQEKIRTERSHKKANPDANKIVNPPLMYEMKPPPPRSTFNTKNDFKAGNKRIRVAK